MAKKQSKIIFESLVKPLNLMRYWKERSWSSEARFARLNQLQKSEEAKNLGGGGCLVMKCTCSALSVKRLSMEI